MSLLYSCATMHVIPYAFRLLQLILFQFHAEYIITQEFQCLLQSHLINTFEKYNKIVWFQNFCSLLFFKLIYSFLERGAGREKKGERSINARQKHPSVAPHPCLDWGPNSQRRHVPDQESNRLPFALQDDNQPTEPLVRLALYFITFIFAPFLQNPHKGNNFSFISIICPYI